MKKSVKIYTDGACSGNPGPGGWGSVLIYGRAKKEISGYSKETTNNRMELTAAIKALEALKEPCEVELFSDSSYLINGFSKGWVFNWSKNGWQTTAKKPVENIELWKKLMKLAMTHDITWTKVKGHSDNEYNNVCDALATGEIKKRAKKTDSDDG